MVEANKELLRRFFREVEENRRLDLIDEFISPEFINHGTPPGIPPNREGIKRMYGGFFSAFPDMKTEIHHMVGEGDLVVIHKTQSGTHKGAFMTVPASGRTITVSGTDIFEIKNSQITQHWHVFDNLAMMKQLGLLDPPDPEGVQVVMDLMEIPAGRFEEMKRFYTEALSVIGYEPQMELAADDDSCGFPAERVKGRRVGFGIPGESNRPDFWLREGESRPVKIHLAFHCHTHEEVDAFHRRAVAAGGKDSGYPGRRTFMPPNYYGAFVVDPDGNEAEAACWDHID